MTKLENGIRLSRIMEHDESFNYIKFSIALSYKADEALVRVTKS